MAQQPNNNDMTVVLTKAKEIADQRQQMTECHATAGAIFDCFASKSAKLTEGTSVKNLLIPLKNKDKELVYRVDFKNIGHSFAMVQRKKKVFIFQSWEGVYTLANWISGAKEVVSNLLFCPAQNPTGIDTQLVSYYLSTLFESIGSRKTKDVLKDVEPIFCPGGKAKIVSTTLNFKKELDLVWKYATLK